MFNPEEFMNSSADAMATQVTVCPEGEFPFMIDSEPKQLIPENLKGVSKRTGNAYDFWQMTLNCVCLDETVKAKLARQKVTVRLRVNLDLTPTGGLEVGQDKNVALGRLREALGQNTPGWKVANLLGAGPFIGKVEHTTVNGQTYADISRVAKLS
jgi:hypothetical protein